MFVQIGEPPPVLLQDSAETSKIGAVFDRRAPNKNLCFYSSCQSIQTMEHEFYECPEYLSNAAAGVDRTEEYEYEVWFGVFRLNSWTL